MPRESTIERNIQVYLESVGAYAKKYPANRYSGSGKSDRVVCYRGRYIALEVKKPEESYGLTKEQGVHLRKVQQAGGVAASVTSVQDVKALIFRINCELDGTA